MPNLAPATRVLVLAGGDSDERAVSLESGACAVAGLSEAGYAARTFDPALHRLTAEALADVDVCFLALHGGAGEDGRVQRRLQAWDIPFTGSDARASRRAMHKWSSKQRFVRAGVATPPAALWSADAPADLPEPRLLDIGFPLVVKPEAQGSSLGVTVVRDRDALPAALALAARYDRRALLEQFIPGREFTVALLDRQPLPLLEIIAAGETFDYDAKYHDAATRLSFDHNLPPSVEQQLIAEARQAVRALSTRGLARVDLRLDPHDRPWVLEVNTLPGLTSHSLAPLAARRAGLSLPALCDWMVQAALLERRLA